MPEDRRFDAFVMVDWSASSAPGRRSGQANGIWVAVGEPDLEDVVHPFATRAEATAWLVSTCARLADEGRRVLLGVDVAFGYPAGTARALGAPPTERPWRWTWDHLALQVLDAADNANTRFEAADALNRALGADAGPFWGHPPNQQHAHLRPTKGTYPVRGRGGVELAELRHAERWHRDRGRHPKSVWQLSGAGAVGSQTLLGIPRLRQIRLAAPLVARCAVWPQETGFGDPLAGADGGRVVLAEVYPSLAPTRDDLHEVRDAAQVLTLVQAYREMAASGALAGAFAAPDLPPEALDAVVGEEGWILDVPAGVAEAPVHAEAVPWTTAAPARAPAPPRRGAFDWAVEAVPDVRPQVPAAVRRGRLRTAAEAPAVGEDDRELAAVGGTRVVEILSSDQPGHPSTAQDDDEWVVLLEGRAELDVAGTAHVLDAGDWLLIPAGTRHQVTATAAGTRWLAVHVARPPGARDG